MLYEKKYSRREVYLQRNSYYSPRTKTRILVYQYKIMRSATVHTLGLNLSKIKKLLIMRKYFCLISMITAVKKIKSTNQEAYSITVVNYYMLISDF